jgi:cytochrome o ubiquinol oxidase operon protein cyoD
MAGDVTAGGDSAPGQDRGRPPERIGRYLIGLSLAAVLTAASFWAATTGVIYAPAVPIALAVLAIAQMGIHLVFFLNITTAPDNTNNILALAFGVLIVTLVVSGSLWIMSNLDHNMKPMPMDKLIQMQR